MNDQFEGEKLMSASSTPLQGSIKRAFSWSIVLSILLIIAGIFAIIAPPIAGVGITLFVGWLLIFSGAMHIIYGWQTPGRGGFIWELLLGIVYIAAGVYLLRNPVVGLVSLTLGLGAYLVFEAVLEFVLAVRMRPAGRSGWLFLDAAVTLILAFLIFKHWPYSSAWAIGILVGISMIFSGAARLTLSLTGRRLASALT
jgi:uncharacterized membrane protein HdeD (DUF308 family)